MSKLKMLILSATMLVLLAEIAHYVDARPGPTALYEAETLTISRRLLSAERVENDREEYVNLSDRDAEEVDFEEELDVVCLENGSCEERRLLTDHIDYDHVGPNNPITDPPRDPPH